MILFPSAVLADLPPGLKPVSSSMDIDLPDLVLGLFAYLVVLTDFPNLEDLAKMGIVIFLVGANVVGTLGGVGSNDDGEGNNDTVMDGEAVVGGRSDTGSVGFDVDLGMVGANV